MTQIPGSQASAPTRVLVVEDEFIIALDLSCGLTDAGYEVVGPAGNTAAALALVESAAPDIGLLDVNLGGGETSYQIARGLQARQIPFAFLSGYSLPQVSSEFSKVPVLGKPFTFGEVLEVIAKLHTTDSAN